MSVHNSQIFPLLAAEWPNNGIVVQFKICRMRSISRPNVSKPIFKRFLKNNESRLSFSRPYTSNVYVPLLGMAHLSYTSRIIRWMLDIMTTGYKTSVLPIIQLKQIQHIKPIELKGYSKLHCDAFQKYFDLRHWYLKMLYYTSFYKG